MTKSETIRVLKNYLYSSNNNMGNAERVALRQVLDYLTENLVIYKFEVAATVSGHLTCSDYEIYAENLEEAKDLVAQEIKSTFPNCTSYTIRPRNC
jgi:hypothetical protein